MKHKGYTIRWRKSSATWVIYKSGRIVESGFDTESAAVDYLDRARGLGHIHKAEPPKTKGVGAWSNREL